MSDSTVLMNELKSALASLEQTVHDVKEVQKKYETRLADVATREENTALQEKTLGAREIACQAVEDVVALKNYAESILKKAEDKNTENQAWYDGKVAEITKREEALKIAHNQLLSAQNDLGVKQAELLRDNQQLKKDRETLKKKQAELARA